MKPINRRQFFRQALQEFVREIHPASESQESPKKELEIYVRPPGALPNEEDFLKTCQSCGECAQACPFDVIELLEKKDKGNSPTPFIQLNKNPCRWCRDMPCITACPSGALRKEEDTKIQAIAKVSLNQENCLNEQGILCDECAVVCPGDVKAIKMRGRKPHLDPSLCVGCGLCVFHCESDPRAIEFLPQLD